MKTISLCMIAKNEESNIANCLNSVKNIVDEIIVVDTGSNDKTKDIAKKSGAKVFDFKWNDDFSKARNEALKHATKDWILVLDADEELDEESAKRLKELADKENDAYIFVQKNYTDNSKIAGFISNPSEKHGQKFKGWYASLIVRMFRNNKGFKFSGSVHELVEPSIEEGKGRVEASNIMIHHYGNSNPQILKKKMKFYLELCKKKAKESPDSGVYYELGVLHNQNSNEKEAIEAFKKSIELDEKNNRASFELGIIYEKSNNLSEAIKCFQKSAIVKKSSAALRHLGLCLFKKGELSGAKQALVLSLKSNPNNYSTYNILAAVLEKQDNFKESINASLISLKLNPDNPIAYFNLGVVYNRMNQISNAISNYEKAVEFGHNNKDTIKKRIDELRNSDVNPSDFSFSFGLGE